MTRSDISQHMHMRAVVPPVISSLIQQLAEPSVVLLCTFGISTHDPSFAQAGQTGQTGQTATRKADHGASTVIGKSPNVTRVDVQLL